MNEFEKLEAELKELRPVAPSDEFTARLESALGDAGKVAMCCMPEEGSSAEQTVPVSSFKNNKVVSFPRLAAFVGLTGLGLAAVWAAIFYVSTSLVPAGPEDRTDSDNTILANNDKMLPSVVPVNDPDSPINGLSLNQIQDVSVLPVSGWLDPQTNERFLRVVDEGIFQQPNGLPARQVRNYFMDETLWSHPSSDTRILSTTPREEVILIELDTY